MPYVGYFEFNVPDENHTAAFYSAVFGWKADPVFEGYLSVEAGDEPGINTGISRHDGPAHTVATLLVPDVKHAMSDVEGTAERSTHPASPFRESGTPATSATPMG